MHRRVLKPPKGRLVEKIRKSLTYANVMSSLAVFLVLGGASAVAATQLGKNSVGNKQLKNNAVTTAKIKNGTITQGKISSAAQAALRGLHGPTGQTGPGGAAGPSGPKGLEGARGPSEAFTKKGAEDFEVGHTEGEASAVVSLALPAGKWLVTAATGLTNISGATRSAWCKLASGATEFGRTRAIDEAASTARSGSAPVLGGIELPSGGTVELLCWGNGTGIFVPAVSRPAINAIQVATLHIE